MVKYPRLLSASGRWELTILYLYFIIIYQVQNTKHSPPRCPKLILTIHTTPAHKLVHSHKAENHGIWELEGILVLPGHTWKRLPYQWSLFSNVNFQYKFTLKTNKTKNQPKNFSIGSCCSASQSQPKLSKHSHTGIDSSVSKKQKRKWKCCSSVFHKQKSGQKRVNSPF